MITEKKDKPTAAKAKETMAYSYLRWSSDKQEDGDSEARQTNVADEACKRHKWTLDTKLKLDDRGVSAFHGDNVERGKLGIFLRAIKSGEVDAGSVLIVERLDRISRQNLEESDAIFRAILKAKVSIYVGGTGRLFNSASLNNPAELSELQYTFYLANLESQQKSDRIRSAMARRRDECRRGDTIYSGIAYGWLRPNPDYTGYTVRADAAAIVRQVYEDAASGIGVYTLVRKLNADGVKPIGRIRTDGKARKNATANWTATYLRDILKTRVVVGEYQPYRMEDGERVADGEPVKGYYPGIVSESLWQKVQDAIASRRTVVTGPGRPSGNLFQGLLTCENDGSSLKYFQSGKNPYRPNPPRLRSYNWKHGIKGGCELGFPYPPFQDCILALLAELTPADLIGDTDPNISKADLKRDTAKLARLDANLATCEAELLADPDDLAGLIRIKRAYLEQRAELVKAIEAQRRQGGGQTLEAAQEVIDCVNEGLDAEKMDRLRARLGELLEGISVRLARAKIKIKGRGKWFPTTADCWLKFRTGARCGITIYPLEDGTYGAVRHDMGRLTAAEWVG